VTDQELWVTNPDGEDYDLTTDYTYDRDGLITAINLYDQYWNPVAPAMGIDRDPATGRITGTTLGNVTTSQTYNTLGELSTYEADYNGSPIYQTSCERDSLGRIIELNEMVEGKSDRRSYAYDIAGRLWKVWRNDTLVSTYTYDANGNRIAKWTPTQIDSGRYDVQDRLLDHSTAFDSSASYSYTANGELKMKVEGNDTAYYTYDYFGNLVTVILPQCCPK
jgi:YD repeat-containing protein